MKYPKSRYIAATLAMMVLFVVYIVMPVLAGYHRIGNLDGPKICPVGWHRGLYEIGWEANPENVGTPRTERFPSPRPWFYDLNDRRPPG